MDKLRIKELLLELCSIASISETIGEREMSEKLFDILNRIPYFKHNPKHLYKVSMQNDPLCRSFVAALLKGSSNNGKTIILLSHFDVVAVEDFGSLKRYAFAPEEYASILKTENIPLAKEVWEDLESGDYLFGRGIMDMKYGIALDIEIMQQMSENPEYCPGNILFLSVPDEEANSAGMLEAVKFLKQLKEEHSLEYTCCIVSEPHFPKYAGDKGNYIYGGTVGKLLPVFYCTGKETHAGDPFSGFNPNLLTAKLIEKIDQNPELCENHNGCISPAPVCLKSADTKHEYSVQIPTAAYAYFNLITLRRSPIEIMQTLKHLAEEVFQEVLEEVAAKANKWNSLTGSSIQLPMIKPMVYTYSELYELCLSHQGTKLKHKLDELIRTSDSTDIRQLSIDVVQELCHHVPEKAPMIILFFAPPYYPSCSGLDYYDITRKVCRDIIHRADVQFGEKLQLQPYFTGLSDMSYLGLHGVDPSELPKDFPLWNRKYSLPLDIIAELNIPFVNVGPLGKDAHKYTERICISYSFDMLPKLVMDTVINIMLDKL